MKLVSIVPRFFPLIDGIGDYALGHARLLREASGIDTRFIVADPEWRGADSVEGFEITHLARRFASDLIDILPKAPDETVVLHYEGYGYAKRGCPVWLVTALERWRKENRERRLITMFHELYANGPPWTSSFWLSPLQKKLTTQLARLSDGWSTSLESYSRIIQKMSGQDSSAANHLAVFSSIGEPPSAPLLNQRRRRLVVFGTPGRRIAVYRRSMADLNRICRALAIEEVLDIGQSIDSEVFRGLLVRSSVLGPLSNEAVSEILLDSVAGVIDYPASLLAKSTIFGAYCSHRIIPIVANTGDALHADSLETDRHYWLSTVASEQMSIASGQLIADHAFDWYQTHNLEVHARTLAAWLTSTRAAHSRSVE